MNEYIKIVLKYSFILLLCLGISDLFGQRKCLENYRDGKYIKAFECAQKFLKKLPNDVIAHYVIAGIRAESNDSNYQIYTAYMLAKKTRVLYDSIPLEKQTKINDIFLKKKFTESFLDTLLIQICRKAVEDIKVKNSLPAYDEFIKIIDHPIYHNLGIQLKNALAFSIAKSENSIHAYQTFIEQYPNAKERDTAILFRDEIAFTAAKNKNTIDGFSFFIDRYSESVQLDDAIKLRDELAFEATKKTNTVKAYKNFIDQYGQSTYLDTVRKLLYKAAFLECKIEQNSKCFKFYIEQYPFSSYLIQAKHMMDSLNFEELTADKSFLSYLEYYSNFKVEPYSLLALDSLFSTALRSDKIWFADYLAINFDKHPRIHEVHALLKNFFFQNGEETSLAFYLSRYSHLSDIERIEVNELMAKSAQVKNLYMDIGATKESVRLYENFIKSMAPSEIAFVAIQRLTSNLIKLKMYTQTANIYAKFKKYFPNDIRFNNMVALLKKADKEINEQAMSQINTKFDEYNPVPTLDDYHLYFCGFNRKDGIGGEDIFEYNQANKSVTVINELSTADKNEAPLSVSGDGNTMLIWNDKNGGDIYYSNKLVNGWSLPTPFPNPINSKYFEGDAQLTSDGKSLLFVSSRPGGYGLFTDNTIQYHGDNEYPTDIYISTQGVDGLWSDPVNLGPQINTKYSERSPFLHPDGRTLYFSSDGHYGLGRLDVFKTKKENDSSWTIWEKPKNLGKKINTCEKDWGFKFSTDGSKGYYSKSGKRSLTSIIFLLDISGSMGGQKIVDTKNAAKEAALTALKNNSEVAILMFNGSCTEPITNMTGFSTNIIEIVNTIESAIAGGGTPMYTALKKANDYMKTSKSPYSKDQLIILMSDGDAQGCVELDQLLGSLKRSSKLYKYHTIGLEVEEGSRAYNDLNFIAQASGGKFIHAQSSNQLGRLFADATNSLYNLGNLGTANKDIFSFTVPDELKPEAVITIAGVIKDKNGNPIQVSLEWEDLETGKNMGVCKSDPRDGSYFIALPQGRLYGYFVAEPGFFPSDNNIDLRSNLGTGKIDEQIVVFSIADLKEGNIEARVNNIFFDYNKFMLKPESYPQLNKIILLLGDTSLHVEIGGHTDGDGDDQYNLELSEKRAQSVLDYLTTNGAKKINLTSVGYGETKPVATNTTDKDKQLNRRVEFKFSSSK